jgi:FHA domain
MLDVVDGPSRRVGPSGVLIGRQGDCDIVARDPSVSRRHALVRLTIDGVEVVPLGRAPVDVNRAPVDKPRLLADGDELRVPGLTLTVAISLPRPDPEPYAGFVLDRERGGSFGIAHTPFVIGGGERDDLIVRAWPPRTLALHVAQGELFLQVCAGEAERNGVTVERDAMEPLVAGDRVTCRDEQFVVRPAGPDATTAVHGAELPSRVEIEMLPRGGRVVFTTAAGPRAVYLADRRFDLVVALARPPGEHAAGDFVSDDVLRGVVWPRKPSVSRPEINMLISRCRRDLVEAGLAGPRLIERAPGGGGTRLAIARGAEIVVKA